MYMRDVTGGRGNGVAWPCAGVVTRDLSMGWEYTGSLNSWMVLYPYESLFLCGSRSQQHHH